MKKAVLKKIKVQIDRKTWLRGGATATLRNDQGNQCCLGFVCKKLGLKNEHILDIGHPYGVVNRWPPPPNQETLREKLSPYLLTAKDSNQKKWVSDAIGINDNVNMSEEEREEKLTKLFAKNGFELKFIGPKVNPFV